MNDEKKLVEENNLNYKVDTYKMDFGSKKFKNILIIGLILFIVLVLLGSLKGCQNKNVSLPSISSKTTATDGVSNGVSKVYDSVVYISNYSGNKKSTTGTGFVYKKNGGRAYIITNYHIAQRSNSLKVSLSNGKTFSGKYLGGDKYLDIAILSISSSNFVKVAKLGSSKTTPLGATLFTVGSPLGDEYQGTVTKGILSGKDRLVSVSVNGERNDYVMKVLQTDAAMSPGSSGGPLCNSDGQVIGVNSMKFVNTDIEGMAFAVPIEDVNKYLSSFEKGNSIKRPYIGITMLNMSEKDELRSNNFNSLANSSSKNGIVVVSVKGSTPSYGKIKRGDIINKINGTTVSDIAHLRYELFKYKRGDTVSISFDRDGSNKTVKLRLSGE